MERKSIASLEKKLAFSQRLKQMTNALHAAKDLDEILTGEAEELPALFGAKRLTIYAVDYDRGEIFSKYLDPTALREMKEIRLPIDGKTSVAGFVAMHRSVVNLANAYDPAELAAVSPGLKFDDSWDKLTGFRTKQLLTVPAFSKSKVLTGVIQVVNRQSGAKFAKQDEENLVEFGLSLGIALYNHQVWIVNRRAKFDHLLLNNLIPPAELDAAITEAQRANQPVEPLLMSKHGIRKEDIGKALSQFYQCPFFDEAKTTIPLELIKDINPNYLKKNLWAPIAATDDAVEVVIDDPRSFPKIQDIRRIFPGKKVKTVVGLGDDILRVIGRIGHAAPEESIGAILVKLEAETAPQASLIPDTKDESISESSSAVVRLANQIIFEAHDARASDIHIEPNSDEHATVVRIRVDGDCRELLKVPPGYRRALTSRLKIMARLDISERRRPQDGKIRLKIRDRDVELRVATMPTAGIDNEDVVLRILATGEPPPLEKLAFSERTLSEFKSLLEKPYGLVLCVGPTGSGKTTTLHAALGAINTPDRKIWTAEDPVEITQPGLRQVQVNPKIDFTFSAAMRSFLRADPDVIMVGEMRDQETAETAIEASLTGHLVLSTLHTNNAAETITRLLEMGMEPFSFADSLLCVLGQRLVRTICPKCTEKYQPTPAEVDALVAGYGEKELAALGIVGNGAFPPLARGRGCEECNGTGYRGRMGIHELLVASDEIKKLVRTRASVVELKRVAMAEGMTTLLQDGILKILSGATDHKQVWSVAMR